MSSKSVKPKREVVKDEEGEDTYPFDADSTNLQDDDPLADVLKSSKAKEEVGDKDTDGGRRLRSHSNSNSTGHVNSAQQRKVFIIVERKSIGHRTCGRPRKYYTEEERLKAKAAKERKRRAEMMKEHREEYLRKAREANRLRRIKLKEEAEKIAKGGEGQGENDPLETDDEEDLQTKPKRNKYEEVLQKQREYVRRKRQEDPEKYREKKKREKELRKEKYPEKYKEQIRKAKERRQKLKEEDPEKYKEFREKEKLRRQLKGYKTKYKKPETEEQREKKKKKHRLWYRKQMETEEGREMIRFRQYSRVQMKLAQMTDEERKAWTAKNTEAARKWRYNLTGEKLERYRERTRKASKKYFYDHELAEHRRQRFKAHLRQKTALETPEQRQKRLRRYKINQAISKLRKQLEEIGVPEEEVERRVTELKNQMQAEPLPPLETLSTYKPRMKTESSCTPPPRPYTGKRKGRPLGTFRKLDASNEVSSNSQTGMCSSEMEDSNHFDDDGFQCDSTFDDDTSNRNKADLNNESAKEEPEPVPILHFDIKCPHCPSTYSERTDLISHISSEHSKICWKCPKCKMIVLSSEELGDHYKKEHLPVLKGTTTTETSTSNSGCEEMCKKKENIFTCIKCDPLKSSISERTFENVKDLMCHVESAHPQSFWPCSKCNLLKYTESSLKIHKRVCKRAGKRTKKPNGRKR